MGHLCAAYEIVPIQDLEPYDFGVLSVCLDEMPPHQRVGITVGVGFTRLQGACRFASRPCPDSHPILKLENMDPDPETRAEQVGERQSGETLDPAAQVFRKASF